MEGLKKEEEITSELKEAHLEIKDLEAELEFMHSREPDNYKYIAYLTNRIDVLYKKMEELDENN